MAIEVGQSCADQIRLLAKGSRGSELLAIMYSDPYSRMLELVEEREYELMEQKDEAISGSEGLVIGSCRSSRSDNSSSRSRSSSSSSMQYVVSSM